MKESYYKIDNEHMYIRFNKIDKRSDTLLLVHGLGDSGLSYEQVFKDRRFSQFNIVVPDLIGYGRSSSSENPDGYSFEAQVERLWRFINENELKNINVVGHSMGGDISTLLCHSDQNGIIKRYINVEGDLTQYDLSISRNAVEASENGGFDTWFEDDFKNRFVFEGLKDLRSGRLYYASVCFCRRQAFRENARELVQRNTSLPGKYKSEIGKIYRSLSIPRVLCYGTLSLPKETLAFLEENNLSTKAFADTGHCPHLDMAAEFYDFLSDYVIAQP